MGSYDGAETCELVGSTFILSQLKELPYSMEIELYRDDDLAVLDQTPQRNLQSVRQKQPMNHHRSQQKSRKFP